MNSTAHSEYREMLASYALTALDARELRAVAAHLESCTDCRAELVQWQETAGLLAFAAQPVEPSPEVRSHILQEVNRAGAKERRMDQAGPKVTAMRPARKTVLQAWPSWQALAASLAFLALCLTLLIQWRENSRNRQELARLSNQIQHTNRQISYDRELIAILSLPGSRRAQLSGTDVAPGARATIAYDPTGRAILLATGLPPAATWKAYQLWFIVGKQPLPGKLFKPLASGEAFLNDQVPAAAFDAAVFAVTLEPESGVRVPTGELYLSSAG